MNSCDDYDQYLRDVIRRSFQLQVSKKPLNDPEPIGFSSIDELINHIHQKIAKIREDLHSGSDPFGTDDATFVKRLKGEKVVFSHESIGELQKRAILTGIDEQQLPPPYEPHTAAEAIEYLKSFLEVVEASGRRLTADETEPALETQPLKVVERNILKYLAHPMNKGTCRMYADIEAAVNCSQSTLKGANGVMAKLRNLGYIEQIPGGGSVITEAGINRISTKKRNV